MEERPRKLVEGDFQAGVWNESALQQKNNPYAEEWYPNQQNTEAGQVQKQIGQNNMVLEEEHQRQVIKLGYQNEP